VSRLNADQADQAAQALQAGRRYAAAVVNGDDDAMRAICDPEVEIWHNTDGVTQSLEDNIRLGQWLRRKVPGISFTQVQLLVTDEGFVQRHRMRGQLAEGAVFDVPSCLVATVSVEGLIVRVEEYLDSAALAPLRAANGSGSGSR
jgi:uncharacterized protein